MRWFGSKWGAIICQITEEATPPIGEPCFYCKLPIDEADCGLLIPHVEETVNIERPWHLDCFLRSIKP